MPDLADFLIPLDVGTSVTSLTGKSQDGFVAGGFASFVYSLTGEPPTIVPMPGKKASLILTARQKQIMQKWLDTQFAGALAKPKDETLTIELNPVLLPWAIKIMVPVAVMFVVVGWVSHWYLSR